MQTIIIYGLLERVLNNLFNHLTTRRKHDICETFLLIVWWLWWVVDFQDFLSKLLPQNEFNLVMSRDWWWSLRCLLFISWSCGLFLVYKYTSSLTIPYSTFSHLYPAVTTSSTKVMFYISSIIITTTKTTT